MSTKKRKVLRYRMFTVVQTCAQHKFSCVYVFVVESNQYGRHWLLSNLVVTLNNEILQKMLNCVVKNCPSDTTCLVSFHKLPTELCQQWKLAIGKGDDFVPKKTQRICNLHFSSASFTRNLNRNRLKKGAVPTTDLDLSSVYEGSIWWNFFKIFFKGVSFVSRYTRHIFLSCFFKSIPNNFFKGLYKLKMF